MSEIATIAAVVVCGRVPSSEHGDEVAKRLREVGFGPVRQFASSDSAGSPMASWVAALSWLYLSEPKAEFLAVVEDDVAICRDLAAYLSASVTRKDSPNDVTAFFSPYCPGVYYRTNSEPHWFAVDQGAKLVGACFVVFPRQSVEMLLQDANLYRASIAGDAIDGYLGRWAKQVARTVRYHSPSLVQHVGLKPSDSPRTKLRQATTFVGEYVSAVEVAKAKWKEPSPVPEMPRAERPNVSVIVAGRNSEKWVYNAIASVIRQTEKCEVIYSDDASTDHTVEIVRRLIDSGVIVVQSSQHQGVVAARNRGAAAARGRYLCFLDADDEMPSRYIALHLDAMRDGCPFVYGAAMATGDGPNAGQTWEARQFSEWDRWAFNTVNTSALYRRTVFESAGGWRDAPTMWDYDLALRAIRVSELPPVASEAVLEYRQHSESWSHAMEEKSHGRNRHAHQVRKRNARLSVGCLWSGRLPKLFGKWFEGLSQSVRCAELAHRPDCVILYDADADAAEHLDAAMSQAARFGAPFSTVKFVRMASQIEAGFATEKERRDAVATHLARASDQLRSEVGGDALWIVEDDILVPLCACSDLWDYLTAGQVPVEVVSGVYRNRHVPERLVGGWLNRKTAVGYLEPTQIDDPAPKQIDIAGCGCVMLWLTRPQMPRDWPSHCSVETVLGRSEMVPAHDWAFCAAVKQNGGSVWWLPSVRCEHAVSERDFVSV